VTSGLLRVGKVALLGSAAFFGLLGNVTGLAWGHDWPIRKFRGITATFAESRPGHFHGGVDLSTENRVGEPVFAVGDGYLYRLKASGTGYGRAVYVMLDDGVVAVCGHLSAFSQAITELVHARQLKERSYEVDFFLPEGRYRIRRGELLGFSGKSGFGSPHLHFELRRGAVAVNPLRSGFNTPDRVPPTLIGVTIVPRTPVSTVGGAPLPLWVPFVRGADAGFAAPETVSAWGRFTVRLKAYDTTELRPNRLGLYYVALYLDGERMFQLKMDSFDLASTRESDLVYGFEEGRGRALDSYMLSHPAGVSSAVWGATDSAAGELSIGEPGREGKLHELRIVARDANGNETSGIVLIEADPPILLGDLTLRTGAGSLAVVEGRLESPAVLDGLSAVLVSSGDGESRPLPLEVSGARGVFRAVTQGKVTLAPVGYVVKLKRGGRTRASYYVFPEEFKAGKRSPEELRFSTKLEDEMLFVSVSAGETRLAASPVVTYLSRGAEPVRRVGVPGPGGTFGTAFSVGSAGGFVELRARGWDDNGIEHVGSQELQLFALEPRTAGKIWERDSSMAVVFPPGSLYRRTAVALSARAFHNELEGLTPLGALHAIRPFSLALKAPVEIDLRTGRGAVSPAKVGLFHLSVKGEPQYVPARFDRNSRSFQGFVEKPGEYFLAVDDSPPELALEWPAPGDSISNERPFVLIRVEEAGAGVDPRDIEMTLDGRPVYGEWDQEEKVIRYRPWESLAPGRHEVSVRVTDRAENDSRIRSEFYVVH